MTTCPLIYSAMVGVERDLEVVRKDRKNEQQGYKFRGIDDVYNAVHAALGKHGVFTIPRTLERAMDERQTKNGGTQFHVVLKMEYDFVATDGSKVTAGPIYGEGLDVSDKATNKGMSMAQKYTLLQVFSIPTTDLAEGDKVTIEAGAKRGLDGIPTKSTNPEPPPNPNIFTVPELSKFTTDELRIKLMDKEAKRNTAKAGSAAFTRLDEQMVAIRKELALRASPPPSDDGIPFGVEP